LLDTPTLTTKQVQQVERDVNEKIKNAIPVEVKVYEEGDETLSKVLLLMKNTYVSVYLWFRRNSQKSCQKTTGQFE
jgi:hypothetical protein